MIVTGETADTDEGAAAIGSGTAGFVVDALSTGALSFAAAGAGEGNLAGSAVRFVTFCMDDFFVVSASARVLMTGRAAAARGARAVAVGDGLGATSATLSCCAGCCCERSVSPAGCCRGTATVAITSTATPASVIICPGVGCQVGVGGITGPVTTVEVDSTADCVATTGAAAGTAVVVIGDVIESGAA